LLSESRSNDDDGAAKGGFVNAVAIGVLRSMISIAFASVELPTGPVSTERAVLVVAWGLWNSDDGAAKGAVELPLQWGYSVCDRSEVLDVLVEALLRMRRYCFYGRALSRMFQFFNYLVVYVASVLALCCRVINQIK
jgi:hypothetical protein